MSLDSNGKPKRFRQSSIADFFSAPKRKKREFAELPVVQDHMDVDLEVIADKQEDTKMDVTDVEEIIDCEVEKESTLIEAEVDDLPANESSLLAALENIEENNTPPLAEVKEDDGIANVSYEDFLKQYEDEKEAQNDVSTLVNKTPKQRKKLSVEKRSNYFASTSAVADIVQTSAEVPVGMESASSQNSSQLFKIYDSETSEGMDSQSQPTSEKTQKSEKEWGGVDKSLLQIYSQCSASLPELKTSVSQFVLFDDDDLIPELFDVKTTNYVDKWDGDHVRLPCSQKSLYPVEKNRVKKLTKRWDLISSSLYSGIKDSCALEEAILKYNSRFPGSFKTLHTLFLDVMDPAEARLFFETTLPKMIDLAISLPKIVHKPIPMLSTQINKTLFLTQRQIACLLANAFFCTFPRRNAMGKSSEYYSYPSINFNRIFEKSKRGRPDAHLEKLRTVLHYFQRVTEQMPSGVVSFERRVIDDFPRWSQSPCSITKLHVSKSGLIEDQDGFLQVDFANKMVGGGVLGDGLVQEEIRFLISPELIISRLFTEKLDNNECLVVKGAERFSSYTGYAETYKWNGDFIDLTPCDRWQRKNTELLVMDATRYNRSNEQYRPGNLRRELNKAFCGFYCNNDPDHASAIATGNWGCGAFQGDPMLKCIIQLMAAAAVGRDLLYLTFNDQKLMNDISEMYNFIKTKDWNVCELWNLILKYNEDVSNSTKKDLNIYNFMLSVGSSYDSSTDCESS